MKLTTQLFMSPHLKLDAYDPEKDAAEESGFTVDLNYLWAMNMEEAAHPLTVYEIKKKREAQLKKVVEGKPAGCFAIRRKEDDRFIGVVAFPWISWTNRNSDFRVMIGNVEKREEYLVEAVHMALRYAFEELGSYSVDSFTGEFQPEMMEACQQAGMRECVRQREAVYRNGRLWDRVIMAIDLDTWLERNDEEVTA